MGLFDFWRRKVIRLTDGGFWSQFAGGGSHAGETVSQESVLQIGAAYACARKLAEGVSCLPFSMNKVDRRTGALERAADHRLVRILGDQPNADQPAQQFWELVMLQLVLRGNHYSLKLSTGGTLDALEPLPPHPQTYCRRDARGYREFVVTCGPRKGVYPEAEVFFIPGFGEELDCGLPVITLARHTFGRLLALERHQSNLIRNGVRPSMILTTKEGAILTPEQRQQVKDNIVAPFTGAGSAGGMMVLEGGFDVKTVTMTPADAQMLEQFKFGVEEICRWFGMPPWLVGYTGAASNWGTGLEQQFRAYATLTLQPYVKRILGEVRRQLMSPQERARGYEPAMPLDALYEGDSKTIAEVAERYVRGGIKAPNEIRAQLGLPPKDGGDELRMQQQMVPVAGTQPTEPDDEPDPAA
ncbi:phage portal protein [Hyphomonas sp.]|uniref:phage portal protein n=1 Tax=Hyphomonas sp. TaxID=87 RepID=UPI00391945C9